MATDSTVTNKNLIALRFARSTPTYDHAAVVQRMMANELVASIERLAAEGRFRCVLELGCGTGLFTEQLLSQLTVDHLTLNDIIPSVYAVANDIASSYRATQVSVRRGDMESIDLPCDQDLVVSNAVLQWSEEAETMLQRMLTAVRPGGMLALTTFGRDNLAEKGRNCRPS